MEANTNRDMAKQFRQGWQDGKKVGIKEVTDKTDKMILRLKAICLPGEHRLMRELEIEWLKLKEWSIVG